MAIATTHARPIATLISNHFKKISLCWIHSLHHHHKPPPQRHKFYKFHPKKPSKAEAKPPNPVYMRNTINNISKILRFSTWDSAQEQLKILPIKWDSYTVNQVLKTHPPMEKSWLFFNWASHLKGFKHDQFTYTTMLDIFGEAGRISSMSYVFGEMEEKGIQIDAVTYTSILHWLSKDGDLEGSVRAWEEMMARGCRPTVVSYTAFMKVLFDHGRPKEAAGIYREMLEVGLSPNCHTYTVLMEYLAGVGKFEAVFEIMSKMQEAGIQPDKATCNILIQKCSKSGEISAMVQILQYMKEHSIVLRRPIFLETLEAFKISGECDHLLREVNPHLAFEGIEEESSDSELTATDISFHIDRNIIFNLLARQNLVAIEHILNGMIYKNIKLDSGLISAVVQANCANCRTSGALMAFDYCKKMGKKLEKSAYISLVGFFIRTNSFQKVLEVVEEMIKAGISLGTYLVSLLIYRLGRAGLSASAAKIFFSSPTDHNTATYTSMIDAYFRGGEVDKGLELYSEMKRQGIPASSGTYEVLIVGLEDVNRIHDAEAYKKEKKRLQWHDHSRERLSLEESLSNRLFDVG